MRHVTVLVASFALASLTGCVVRSNCPPAAYAPTEQVWVKVDAPPPALRAEVEVQPARPSAAAVWVDGHYEWRGTWVWVDGFWDTPRAGYVWTAPVVVRVEGGYQYHPGYYRPARATPPPVYTRPSTVRVSVRPAATATATGTVQVRTPAQPATGTVQVRTPAQPATGTVQVRTPEQPATGTVQVRGPTAQATATGGATVTAAGTARVNAPAATATTTGTARVNAPTAQPSTSGTARVNAPTATATGTARVNAPTASSGARVQGPTTATVRPATMATAGGTARVNAPTAGAGATTPAPTMATVRPPSGSATVAGTTTPSTMDATTPPPTEAGNLRCSINTPRAPAGGYITINGNGFGNNTTVMIGGDLAAIQTRRGSQLRVEVPRGSGGTVQVTAGQRTATCGTLEVINR